MNRRERYFFDWIEAVSLMTSGPPAPAPWPDVCDHVAGLADNAVPVDAPPKIREAATAMRGLFP